MSLVPVPLRNNNHDAAGSGGVLHLRMAGRATVSVSGPVGMTFACAEAVNHQSRTNMPLSVQLFVLLYSVAAGFVTAGIVGSFYQLVTSEPARFALLGSSAPAMLVTFLFCGVVGPFIIMRNAVAAQRKQRPALGWIVGSVAIAGMWSACSGLIVLDFALAAQASL
ncbi:hypothetical protein SAMN02745157_2143 [Kaistia soli DSM 19436]|uniref:Uncharacterized protein n=1 Tax=Kaistia soli DSM 19436 TaxID=1122133 RepID=A0A1M5AIA6_9HYPH|nr:hypothetical protein [Kaistia soli]SHF30050.1 hypothetical protein SAMN02745157_2143 [Kaistia soli DSM 19436]